MKVALIVSSLEDYTVAYANALSSTCEVMLCVPRRQYAHLARDFAPSVRLELLYWPRHRSPGNLALLAKLGLLLADFRPDVVHFLSHGVVWLNALVPVLKLFRRCTVITTTHDICIHPGDQDSRKVPEWSMMMLVRNSHAIVVHGPRLKDEAERLWGLPPDRVGVVPHPALTRYARIAADRGLERSRTGSINVLFFGRMCEYKGLDVLIDAANALCAECDDLRFVIAGRCDDVSVYTGRVQRPECFEFLSRFIPDEEVASLFVDADIVALPYVEGSQSGVLAVAAAFGKPVVATDVGELGRTVAAASMGLVVRPGDARDLARAIGALAADEQLRADCAANATLYAETAISAAEVAKRALEFYDRIRWAREHGTEPVTVGR